MEELEKRVAQSKQAMETAKAALEEMRQKRNDLRKSIEEEKAALQELFIKQNTARMNVVTAQERKAEAEQGYGDLKSEELEIDRKQEQINQDKEAINQELQRSRRRIWNRQLPNARRNWMDTVRKSQARPAWLVNGMRLMRSCCRSRNLKKPI